VVHYHSDIRRARLHNFRKQLAAEILEESIPLAARFAPFEGNVSFAEREQLEFSPINEGAVWGSAWQSAWFHLVGKVPAEWAGSEVVARIDLAGEILVFDGSGCPLLGLTHGSVFDHHYNKDILRVFARCVGGEPVSVWLEAAANTLFGIEREDPEQIEDPARLHGHHQGMVKAARLCRFNRELWHLWLDVDVLLSLHEALPEASRRQRQLLRALNQAADAFAVQLGPNPKNAVNSKAAAITAARAILAPYLALPADPGALELVAVGHAHIDTGWLWPVKESVRKCGRTFASQIDLMERYPDYVFGASQAQHYQFVKDRYPLLYAKIKAAVAAGRWEVQGGMWVEADANLISGESMVRQLVLGKHFFKREFGVDVKNLWLPDVFGYSGNLPQILVKSGCPYFLTQKLSWSKYNKFPHNTFMWRGIDGSEVLTHFPPESNYNADVTPGSLLKADAGYQETAICNEAISLFGIGNGGGGPKEEYLERALRVQNLNGLPRYRLGAAQPVLEKLGTYKAELGTWQGELYLEVHRGTLTTQANIKRLNRRVEEALRATEMLCSTNTLTAYPQAELDLIWKVLLLNQFHDILPGSSIHSVYEVATAELETALLTCRELQVQAVQQLSTSDTESLVLFNASSTAYAGPWVLPEGFAGVSSAGAPLVVQNEGNSSSCVVHVPAQSFVTLQRTPDFSARVSFEPVKGASAGQALHVLENALIRYEFDAGLGVVSAFDKRLQREIVTDSARGNELSLYEDRPHAFDAWDVDEYYEQGLLGVAAVEGPILKLAGAVRSGLSATLRIGSSSIQQTVWLSEESTRLDFVTEVEWNERHKMLRVAFPTRLRASEASFEIQYGVVRRPTHQNTSWDAAQFEVVGHRYADLSESDWGVALLNDCKYGYKVREGVLDLNLLRAPTDPDPVADRGQHRFTYSLLPHTGDLASSDVLDHAAMLNQGLVAVPGRACQGALLPVAVIGSGVELSVVKKAEEQACLVVRVVETRGVRTQALLKAVNPRARIVPTNLVEWEDNESQAATGEKPLSFTPFDIQTFKIWSE